MKRKHGSFILAVFLSCTLLTGVVSADPSKNLQPLVIEDTPIELTVYEHNQGILAPANSSYQTSNKGKSIKKSYKIKQKGKNQKQKLYQVENGEDLPYSMVLDVHGDQSVFQAVGELNISRSNFDAVKIDDRISNDLKSDINKIMSEINERNLTATTLTLYSPNLLPSNNSSGEVSTLGWTSPTYWWGEGGFKYKLETLMITNYVSNTADTLFSSELEAKNYWGKVFENSTKVLIDEVMAIWKIVDIPYKVAGIIPWPSNIGGNTGDRIRAYTTENKNKDYYSIQFPKADFTTKAIGEETWHRWVGITIVNGISSMYQSSEIYKITPKKQSGELAHYAYLFRDSIAQYREYFRTFDYFGHKFSSATG